MTTRYVNTASTAGGDGTTNATSGANRAYASLSEWEAAEQAILSEDHEVLCEGSTADSTACTIDGWTVGSFRITVKGNTTTNGKHAGIYSTSKYRVELSTTGGLIVPIEEKTIIRDLIVYNTNTSGSGIGAGLTLGADIEALNIIARGSGTITIGSHQGIAFADVNNLRTKVKNVISYGWNTGIYVRQNSASTDDTYLVNDTVYGCTTGIRGRGAANVIQAWNNLCKGNTDDFNDTGFDTTNSGNNAQADGAADAPGSGDIDLSSYSDANTFVDAAGGDFHLNSSGTAYSLLDDAGVGPTSNSAVPTDDIDGDTRSGTTTSVGADVIVSGGQTIAIGVGTLSVSSFSPALGLQLPINVTGLTVAGSAPSLALNTPIPIGFGPINVTGIAPTLGQLIGIGVGSVFVSGFSISFNLSLQLEVGSTILSGFAPTLSQSVVLPIGVGSVLVNGYTLNQAQQLSLGLPSTVTVSGYAPNPTFGAQTIQIGTGTIDVSGYILTPTLTGIGIGTGSFALSGAALSLGVVTGIGTADVLASGFVPELRTALPISVGSVSVGGYSPSLSTSTGLVQIGSSSVVVGGYSPQLITGYPTVDIGSGSLNVLGLAPTVEQLLLIRQNSARPDASIVSARSDMTLSSKRTST